ncbi:MAG: 50S ribosomal protein L27 [Patescibacteria group bacterium]
MAHTKAKGSTKNNRDSQSQRLGVKVFGGEKIRQGGIILRQRGSKYFVGQGVKLAGDDSVFATQDGVVTYQKRVVRSFTGHRGRKTTVSVL